jgi:hypothetical protein
LTCHRPVAPSRTNTGHVDSDPGNAAIRHEVVINVHEAPAWQCGADLSSLADIRRMIVIAERAPPLSAGGRSYRSGRSG